VSIDNTRVSVAIFWHWSRPISSLIAAMQWASPAATALIRVEREGLESGAVIDSDLLDVPECG
jgi:hypothetical protein